MTIHDLPTPALLLDRDVLAANLRRMASRAESMRVALRPHVKTHKCLQVARLQRDEGASGITVSTLREAEVFADDGFSDITWAFPVILGRLEEARRLAERVRLGVVIDSRVALDRLLETGFPFRVWLKVDCGYHRAGVDPDRTSSLDLVSDLVRSHGLDFAGILTHSGHAYGAKSREQLRQIAGEERDVMVRFAEAMRSRGIEGSEVSVGSTPAMSVVDHLDGVTEMRPGNYAFHDHMQVVLGSCEVSDCAVTVLSSVVSSSDTRGHSVIDAGALALSKDAGLPQARVPTMGEIFEDYAAASLRGDLRVTSLTQEHGKLNFPLKVGTRVRILPNHSCLTVAQFDEYHVVRGEEVVDRWRIRRER